MSPASELTEAFITAAIAIAGILTALLLGATLGYVILKPFVKASRGKKGKGEFCLSDLFALTFLLVIPFIYIGTTKHVIEADT